MKYKFSLFIWLSLFLTASPLFAQQEIKIGMSGRYYPFTFVKKDKLQGFEVDLWKEIAKRNGFTVKFITANFSGLFGMLEAGHIDTIANQITLTSSREKKYLFSAPYVYDGAQIVVKKGRKDIHSLEDLGGKRVAVNLGSNFASLLKAQNKNIEIITYDSGFEQDVLLGRTDAFIMDRVGSAQLIKQSGLPLQLAGKPFASLKNAYPFLPTKRGRLLLQSTNQALREMRQDGTLTKISTKWFATDITKE